MLIIFYLEINVANAFTYVFIVLKQKTQIYNYKLKCVSVKKKREKLYDIYKIYELKLLKLVDININN